MTETYKQTSETRVEETAQHAQTEYDTLKRQRIRGERSSKSTSTRARSADESFRKSGRGPASHETSSTTLTRQALDASWTPREHHSLLKRLNTTISPHPPSPPHTPIDEQITQDTSVRRHSDSSDAPLDQRALNSTDSTTKPFGTNPRAPLTPKPQNLGNLRVSKFQSRTQRASNQPDLDRKLKDLLLGGEESENVESQDPVFELPASSNKTAQIAEKRKQRELQKAEELRVEAQRKADELKKIEKERLEREALVRLRRRLPNKPLVEALDPKWEQQVDASYLQSNTAQTITTSIGGTELAVKDFRTLLGRHAWLNDEIINSYIEWVVDAANKALPPNAPVGKEKPVPKLIAHNSFFFENLTKKGPTSTDRLMKRKGAGGKSLLQVDTIFVPICRGSHWTIGAVRPVAKTIEYFDSFGGPGADFIKQMRGWLKHQLGDAYIASEWKEPRTGCAAQSNGFDCGVFVCTNAFCVAFGLETSCYRERDMSLQRRRIAALLINRGFEGEFAWDRTGL